MSTFNYTGLTSTQVADAARNQYPMLSAGKGVVLYNKVTVTDTTVNTDVIQALAVPDQFLCLGVAVKIVTADAQGANTDVGDGSGADSWDANIDLSTTAGTMTVSAGGTDAYATTMKLYTSADTIDLTVTGAVAGLSFEIWAFGFDLSSQK